MEQDRYELLTTTDYEALLNAVGQSALVSVTDSHGNIIFVNDKFVEISKYDREELLGQNHRILKSGHQPDSMFINMWQTIVGGGIWRGDIKNRAKDGSYYWVDTSIAPILGDYGKPVRYVAVRFLITDKKHAEENLEEQNQEMKTLLSALTSEQEELELQINETAKFKLAVANTSDHVVITDPEGFIIYANKAAEQLTGYSNQEIVGKKAGSRDLWGGLMESAVYKKMWHTIKVEKRSFIGEIKNRRKNGEVYYALTTISPVLDENNEVLFFVGIERDITKEKEIDRAKTEFVSLASHQLRTPLSTINWYAEMLLSGNVGSISGRQKAYLEEIYSGSQRMTTLVRSLLNVSRLDLGTFIIEPEATNLVTLLQSVIKEQEPQISEQGLLVETDYNPSTPNNLLIDPKLFRMVFQNLLSNAIKYTPAGGRVTLRTRKNNDVVEVSVSDTGIGIPVGQQAQIFSKLFRADNARQLTAEGTGLGLYIVKLIIEHSGGNISFSSAEGGGTTFVVSLPVTGMKKREGARYLD